MKKLLSLFGVLGLLAFVAMPIYAQEENADAENVVAEAENLVDDAANAVEEAVDETTEFVDDTVETVEDAINDTAEALDETDDAISLDGVEDFNSLFENEEVQNALNELDLTNEEAA